RPPLRASGTLLVRAIALGGGHLPHPRALPHFGCLQPERPWRQRIELWHYTRECRAETGDLLAKAAGNRHRRRRRLELSFPAFDYLIDHFRLRLRRPLQILPCRSNHLIGPAHRASDPGSLIEHLAQAAIVSSLDLVPPIRHRVEGGGELVAYFLAHSG